MDYIAISASGRSEIETDALYEHVKRGAQTKRLTIVDGRRVIAEVDPKEAVHTAAVFASFDGVKEC